MEFNDTLLKLAKVEIIDILELYMRREEALERANNIIQAYMFAIDEEGEEIDFGELCKMLTPLDGVHGGINSHCERGRAAIRISGICNRDYLISQFAASIDHGDNKR